MISCSLIGPSIVAVLNFQRLSDYSFVSRGGVLEDRF